MIRFPHVEKRTCGNVHMWFCVPTIYGKSTLYGFRIFSHLSCSVCISLTNTLENGERGHVDGSSLFFCVLYMHIII